ncbi:MAG: serine hydrolase [Alphaproteobacteria bacterium]|nr:serine hydrolase [Alphaproteobacteria bacterium]
MKTVAAALAALCLVAAGAGSASAQLTKEAQAQLAREDAALDAFAAELDQAAKAPDFVGLAVAVVKHGHIALVRTYGVREAGTDEKVTPDTVFRLASLSKGFAATLAELEIRQGKFLLSDPVTKSVPQFKLKTETDTDAVTVEDVLSHRTGLPPYAYDNLLEAGVSPDEVLSRYADVKLTCKVGECYTYQNTAFNMIAKVIEVATGRSYAEELRSHLIEPLGLTNVSVGLAGLKSSGNWAHPHRRRHNAWEPVAVKQAYYEVPAAGGVNASITDLATWMIAQMGGRPDVLPEPLLDDLRKPRVSTPAETRRAHYLKMPVKSTQYGLGWRTYSYAGHKLVTHSGGVEGYFSQISWLPESRDGIVILSNTRGARAGKILPTWLDYELGLKKQDWFQLAELEEAESAPE